MSATTKTRSVVNAAAIVASTTATPRVIASVVPADSTAARHTAARAAVNTLASVIDASGKAGLGVIVKRYGEVDLAAVRLALRTAKQLAGEAKLRGNMQDTVNRVLRQLTDVDTLTDAVIVAAARNALDQNKQAAQVRRDQKKGLAEKVNDAHATPAERSAALAVLAGMDEQDENAKRQGAEKRLTASLAAAAAAGLGRAAVLAMVDAVFAPEGK